MKTSTCSNCHNEFAAELLTAFDHQLLCPDCLARETVVCSRCGDRIRTDDNAGTCETPLCQHCYSDLRSGVESLSCEDAYIEGVRFGILLMLDVLGGNDENFTDSRCHGA